MPKLTEQEENDYKNIQETWKKCLQAIAHMRIRLGLMLPPQLVQNLQNEFNQGLSEIIKNEKRAEVSFKNLTTLLELKENQHIIKYPEILTNIKSFIYVIDHSTGRKFLMAGLKALGNALHETWLKVGAEQKKMAKEQEIVCPLIREFYKFTEELRAISHTDNVSEQVQRENEELQKISEKFVGYLNNIESHNDKNIIMQNSSIPFTIFLQQVPELAMAERSIKRFAQVIGGAENFRNELLESMASEITQNFLKLVSRIKGRNISQDYSPLLSTPQNYGNVVQDSATQDSKYTHDHETSTAPIGDLAIGGIDIADLASSSQILQRNLSDSSQPTSYTNKIKGYKKTDYGPQK